MIRRKKLSKYAIGLAMVIVPSISSAAAAQPASATTTVSVCYGVDWGKHPGAQFAQLRNCYSQPQILVSYTTGARSHTGICVAPQGHYTIDTATRNSGTLDGAAGVGCSPIGKIYPNMHGTPYWYYN